MTDFGIVIRVEYPSGGGNIEVRSTCEVDDIPAALELLADTVRIRLMGFDLRPDGVTILDEYDRDGSMAEADAHGGSVR